jgi:hypothetical protein
MMILKTIKLAHFECPTSMLGVNGSKSKVRVNYDYKNHYE